MMIALLFATRTKAVGAAGIGIGSLRRQDAVINGPRSSHNLNTVAILLGQQPFYSKV